LHADIVKGKRGGHEGRKDMKGIRRDFSPLSNVVIRCAIEVHRQVGPGLLESTYRRCLTHELTRYNVQFEEEWPIALDYKGLLIKCAYRIDVFVNREIVVEIKSVETLRWIHEAQTLTYMQHSGARTGLLFNFNVPLLRDGLRSYRI
jgi:GxxExxY protein